MQQPLFKREETPNFKNPAVQRVFVEETRTEKELLQKELSVNQSEQVLLEKRVSMMKDFLQELPANDPQYTMLIGQIQMDQVELDELKTRKTFLEQKIGEVAE